MDRSASRPRRPFDRRANIARARGFTLIELLVVIVIIGLLIVLVVPSLAKSRLLAKRVACQANLHVLGCAASVYQSESGDYVPICWANFGKTAKNPWKSWRMNLLPFTNGVGAFNCPSALDIVATGETLHSIEEMACEDLQVEANTGSYGVMYQRALSTFLTPNYAGAITFGHPMWSCAFSTMPGVSWRDPAMSAYLADGRLTKGPVTYPTQCYKGVGTTAILPPSDPQEPDYFEVNSPTRRFADRHCGTNCLFVDGHIAVYETKVLDEMKPGDSNCVWDVK